MQLHRGPSKFDSWLNIMVAMVDLPLLLRYFWLAMVGMCILGMLPGPVKGLVAELCRRGKLKLSSPTDKPPVGLLTSLLDSRFQCNCHIVNPMSWFVWSWVWGSAFNHGMGKVVVSMRVCCDVMLLHQVVDYADVHWWLEFNCLQGLQCWHISFASSLGRSRSNFCMMHKARRFVFFF